ncbi:carboxylate-amine ligase [Friedmanniella endophytica]|uniref:Putative glutamate--cysteine ligase 2 n=1 Tax=Microlunatus kandeliicorticis TaxID=1759536 RepID=A0A7W3ISD2_9ACTN|nr:carboxylate--amine ligase/circularly permuted type 2 ATP-grasp protein [Microlunatus kandeliicorticis]MBA8794366.1 carboxylate-amine ligase [Microlunatus kandeliicorticis]
MAGAEQTAGPRTIGAEEEFHLVDAGTRRLVPRAPELLAQLPDDAYVAELQRCVVEVNTRVVTRLEDLSDELRERRRVLVAAAADLGLGVVASGAVPLSVPAELQVTGTPRYRRMLADYQLLAREQLICGAQVHVGIPEREDAVLAGNRVSPFLPTLLALSASSPFWSDGSDTGYASARTLIWTRWPTTGLASAAGSAEEYDRMVEDLIASGVITDPGMLYFDVRPSAKIPTLELRVCDSCPSVDTIVLIAGLFRALVDRELEHARAGVPAVSYPAVLGRAAVWRAARSGLEGDLVDIASRSAKPAAVVLRELIEALGPQLERNGDLALVDALATEILAVGTSAARQRRALRRRGRLTDVVDQLLAETAGSAPAIVSDDDPTLLHGYRADLVAGPGGRLETSVSWDEAVDDDGVPRPAYTGVLATLAGLGAGVLREREVQIEHEQRMDGVTFRVAGQTRAQLFPVDLVPRIVSADDWGLLSAGLSQRARVLDAFLEDIYGDQQVVHDGVLPAELLDRAPGYRSTGRWLRGTVRAHVCGLDLVCDGPGRWYVLEDNLRIPSGLAYALVNRRLLTDLVGEIAPRPEVTGVRRVPAMLRDTLVAAAPPAAGDDPQVAVLSSGWQDSAWFEHNYLADTMDVPLVLPHELGLVDGVLHRFRGRRRTRIDVLYVRMDEDMLLSSTGHDHQPLRPQLREAICGGTLRLANALGNGVADDKAVYAYVPAMTEYYLGERPVLDSVPTWVCAERDQRDHVLDHLDELVVKPIDGLGGSGVLIGPEADDRALEARRRELLTQPERFVAQTMIALSTHPSFDGAGFHPRHVDLRAFVHLRPGPGGPEPVVVPAALTRVAAPGTKIVNSSAGGGSKDTWIMRDH